MIAHHQMRSTRWGVSHHAQILEARSQQTLEAAIISMEGMSHHWPFPLVPSLTDRWRGAQAGETSASVLSPAAHAGSLLSREVRSEHQKKNPKQLRWGMARWHGQLSHIQSRTFPLF